MNGCLGQSIVALVDIVQQFWELVNILLAVRSPVISRLVAKVLVVSRSINLGAPSTENCSLVGSLLAAFIASILPASLLEIEPIYIFQNCRW